MALLKAGKPSRGAPTHERRLQNLKNELINGKKIIRFSIDIPTKIHDAFKQKCFRNKTSMRNIIISSILKYLDKDDEQVTG